MHKSVVVSKVQFKNYHYINCDLWLPIVIKNKFHNIKVCILVVMKWLHSKEVLIFVQGNKIEKILAIEKEVGLVFQPASLLS
jgi:hypothetical protein